MIVSVSLDCYSPAQFQPMGLKRVVDNFCFPLQRGCRTDLPLPLECQSVMSQEQWRKNFELLNELLYFKFTPNKMYILGAFRVFVLFGFALYLLLSYTTHIVPIIPTAYLTSVVTIISVICVRMPSYLAGFHHRRVKKRMLEMLQSWSTDEVEFVFVGQRKFWHTTIWIDANFKNVEQVPKERV
ncbi:hypothetical protein EDD86DRAFT_209161 [Gorgonomyces haynaldii]|nr:hypothetical protein EDD86DRAFT_209161 [Gorgonomyces haynaldii]